MANKLHVRTGDTVMIISGDDKGETGKVLKDPEVVKAYLGD